jgi:polyisoprenoid-binding protein YceI
MRKRFIVLIAALAVATPLVAQQATMQPPGSHNAALVTAGTYSADPNHTLVSWEVDHLGFSPYFGLIGESTGKLILYPRRPNAAKVDITIPVSKILTASTALTAHLLRAPKDAGGKPDFFGPAPADAHFVSTAVVARGDKAKVTGNLTLNGVTRPVVLDVTFHGAGKASPQMGGKENVGFEARAVIKRSDFGLTFLVPLVSDAVTLKIAAAFTKD